MSAVIYNQKHIALTRRAAAESMVLLKNDRNVLPLSKSAPVALFGRNQNDVFKGGGGAADLWAVSVIPFADGLEKVGNLYEPLLKKYRAYSKANHNNILNKIHSHYTWALAEVPLTNDEVEEAAKHCETAVMFIGRFAAEGFDVKDVWGEYRITPAESAMIEKVCRYFKNTVLVLNVPGCIDVSFLENYRIDALVCAYMPGMEAGNALADVLYGDVNPSAKLPDSWARGAAEYPSNDETFSTDKVVYSEGIYMGYRYFDTFKKDVTFPFGYGLSYTDFSIETLSVKHENTSVLLDVKVTNTGKCAGREIVQCYLSLPDAELEVPYQTLCGFKKTKLLACGESETLTISVNLTDFTVYRESTAEYILPAGDYIFRVGAHSRNTTAVCAVNFSDTVVCRKVKNRVRPIEPINELKKENTEVQDYGDILRISANLSAFVTEIAGDVPTFGEYGKIDCTFDDVLSGKVSCEEFAVQLSDDDLSKLLTADGPQKRKALGLENKELAVGEGTHTHPIKELGIPSSVMQDGPAGVRASAFANPVPPDDEIAGRDCICYPCATALAASWDVELMEEIGAAIGEDLDRCGYNGLCAPGVNLHRNPRCGRNFEYFSEDPLLAAEMAVGEIKGIQQNKDGSPTGKYAVLKHFAVNNSEDKRLVGDSVLSERCARELYLRVFEYVIKRCEPHSIMTAYNKMNGTYTSAHPELVDGICRGEWGYGGWIMTDWSVYAHTVDCLKAGADTVMPGVYVPFEEMLERGLDRNTARLRAANLIRHLAKTKHYKV